MRLATHTFKPTRAHTSDMLGLWRLTRNRYGRRLYDALAARGVTATRMYEYVADASPGRPATALSPDAPVTFDVSPAADCPHGVDFDIPFDAREGELAVVALVDGEPVGRALVSDHGETRVHPLETDLSFPGAYVRRVYVARDHRGRGIATALVGETKRVAAEEFDAGEVHALIAADNRPSQRVFAANGFRVVARRDYARVGPWRYRRTTDAGGSR